MVRFPLGIVAFVFFSAWPAFGDETRVLLRCEGIFKQAQGDPESLSKRSAMLPKENTKLVIEVTPQGIQQVDGSSTFLGRSCRWTDRLSQLFCHSKEEIPNSEMKRKEHTAIFNRWTGWFGASSKIWLGNDHGFYFNFDGYCSRISGPLVEFPKN